jgi:hypothetical protein
MWACDIVWINGTCNGCEWLRYTRYNCTSEDTSGEAMSFYFANCYKMRSTLEVYIAEDELKDDIDTPTRCPIIGVDNVDG